MAEADTGDTHADREPRHFIEDKVVDDLEHHRHGGRVVTRFPPEPNGFLHIGHAKSICLNFGLPRDLAERAAAARCHLRFDDTNPIKEEQAYIDAIRRDVSWLGFDWGEHEHHASDYFDTLYDWACVLIGEGHAYVDDQSAEGIRTSRGTLTRPGTPSPHRDRSPEDNLDLFRRMRAGEFPDGSRVLRARIDMASPNLNLRDPVMYRILHARHPRTGDAWTIYPMYDWAHGQSDWIEGVTHSLCTLEFEDHRPLYDWFIDRLIDAGVRPADVADRPRQTEFARLNLTGTVLSKRKLRQLVDEGRVDGWDDPRMPTLAAMRRRGYTPATIREFCREIGVTRYNANTELPLLEHVLRQDLNAVAHRRLAVLDPLRVVITNLPEDHEEMLEGDNNPEDAAAGVRDVPFSRELWIERDDFMKDPPRKFYRLGPGREVRLRYGYFLTCDEAVEDETGEVVELRCTVDPDTRGGSAPDGRKPKGTIHWVSARHAVDAEVRLYEPLLLEEDHEAEATSVALSSTADTDDDSAWLERLNPESLRIVPAAKVEPAALDFQPGDPMQFERLGYFTPDAHDATPDHPVFNRTVTLKSAWRA